MKKLDSNSLTIILLIAILVIFNISRYETLPEHKILKVVNANEYYIDFNNNGIVDDNEFAKLYDVNAFSPSNSKTTYYQTLKTNLSKSEIMALGIIADDFAKKNFENKVAKIKHYYTTTNQQNNFSRVKIFIQNKDIGETLLRNGLATPYKKETYYRKALNFPNLQKHLENLKEKEIVILNIKNNTYHSINCIAGNKANEAVAYKKSELPITAKPCHVCHQNNSLFTTNQEFKVKNFDFNSGVFNFYFTDFNKRQKPDNQCQANSCKALLNEINRAQSSIDFAIYGIANQPKIINALKLARTRGVKIRWVTDENTKGENIYEEVSSIQKIFPNFKTDNHIYPQSEIINSKYTNAIMHNKFFIFDDKTVFLGSANLSQTDLADFNANTIAVINSPKIAQIYKNEFEQMYNEKFHDLKNRIPNKENLQIDDENLVSVYFSPIDKIITTQIIPLIDNAKKYVYISSFIITHRKVEEALLNAKNRGVDVKIITDATSAGGKYSIHNELRKYGIPVKIENKAGKMHSKSIVIDNRFTLFGSMNLTKSGENKNDENVILIENPKVTNIFKEQFLYLWSSIPEIWLTKTPRAESPQSPGSCSDGIDNDFDGDIDEKDSGCAKTKQ